MTKTIFKASASPFYVKVWVEKCQDVTNELKYQCLERSSFHGYSINVLAIPFLHLILIKEADEA